MKRTLLASTALVAFAGAASAEVTFGGSATLGYNDTCHGTSICFTSDYTGFPAATSDNNYGFYWDANLSVTFSQELDNGVTASATFDIDVANTNTGSSTLSSADYVLSLTSDMASLYYGDTDTAAQKHWKSAGDMESDGFTTDWTDSNADAVLRGDVKYAGVNASVSYLVYTPSQLEQLSIGVDGTFGNVGFTVGYQASNVVNDLSNGDYNANEIFGVSVSTSFSGADVTVAYAKDNTTGEDSTGIKVSYPVGPVTLTAYYVSESETLGDNWGINAKYASGPFAVTVDYQDDQGTAKTSIDGSYDVGNGVKVYAGYYMQDLWDDSYYVAATYDLGGGASLLASYAAGGSDDDEYGAGAYQDGTTVEVTFEF